MSLVVLDIDGAIDFTCDSPWAAISVVTVGDHPNLSNANRIDVLKLCFADIPSPIPGYSLFSDEQAEQILKFVDSVWDEIGCLMIHCHQP